MKSNDKIFINPLHEVFTGKEAEEKIKETNDQQFLTNDGVLSVPIERWATAQQFEEGYWLNVAVNAKEDRNYDHMNRFNNYEVLKGKKFNSVIEIGCGPFSLNSKLIFQKIETDNINNLTLLDPLIYKYTMHPNCGYKNDNVKMINSSIEEFETDETYDLVIMVNVIEHCFDFNKVFEVIDNIFQKKGVFVFSEATVKSDHMSNISNNFYDAGHPLRITDKFLEGFIEEKYSILYKKAFDNLYDQDWRRDFYYILVKE